MMSRMTLPPMHFSRHEVLNLSTPPLPSPSTIKTPMTTISATMMVSVNAPVAFHYGHLPVI
jgi:hypothetical protein